MASSGLIGLPPEFKKEIVGYMLRPSDLKALCLACKDLRQFAIPISYRNVDVRVSPDASQWLAAFVNPANPGRQYIRGVRIHGGWVSDDAREQKMQRIIRTLLSSLITDTLESFCALPNTHLEFASAWLLLQTQRNLQSLELPGDIRNGPEKILDDFPWVITDLKRLRTIVLDAEPQSEEQNQLAQTLLTRLPNVKCLRVVGYLVQEGPNIVDNILGPRSNVSAPSPLLQLSSLKLHGVDLSFGGQPQSVVTKLFALHTLHLEKCLKADALLRSLVTELRRNCHQRFTLKDFKYVQYFHTEVHSTEVLSQFLESFSGLKHLCIDVRETVPLPAIDSVIKHSQSLRTLFIRRRLYVLEGKKFVDKHYSLEDLRELCTSCTSLEQVAVALPAFSDCSCYDDTRLHKCRKYIKAISLLPQVRTVRILSWPSIPEEYNMDGDEFFGSSEYFDCFIQDLATTVFKRLDDCKAHAQRCSPVRVLAFDPVPSIPVCGEQADEIYDMQVFVRGQQIDPFGKSKMVALCVSEQWKFILPESTILLHHDRRYDDPRSE